ncbi:hypothetical protein HK102_000484 [Quaeritorhiza haematococci]|nr:hypothetical protein HK102_000484 [Quaeritorhiza haematococci]
MTTHPSYSPDRYNQPHPHPESSFSSPFGQQAWQQPAPGPSHCSSRDTPAQGRFQTEELAATLQKCVHLLESLKAGLYPSPDEIEYVLDACRGQLLQQFSVPAQYDGLSTSFAAALPYSSTPMEHDITHTPGKASGKAATLPPELLRAIFQSVEDPLPVYDPQGISVQRNRHWYSISIPILWRNVWTTRKSTIIKMVFGHNPALSQGATAMERVDGGPGPPFAPLSYFGKYVRRLILDLRDARFNEPEDTNLIERIASSCPNLCVLRMDCLTFDEYTIERILAVCPNMFALALQGTAMHGNQSWQPNSWLTLERGLSKLRRLDLYNVFYDNNTGFYGVVSAGVGPNLIFLNLGRTWVVDDWVVNIAGRCPNLQSVFLEECGALTDRSISVLSSSCRHLTTVKLRNCVGIGDDGIVDLSRNCPRLKALGISYTQCTDRTLSSLSDYSPMLETLFMNDLGLATEKSVIQLVERRGPTLRTLGMGGCDVVTDKTIVKIATCCPNLEELDISNCGMDEDYDYDCDATQGSGAQHVDEVAADAAMHAAMHTDNDCLNGPVSTRFGAERLAKVNMILASNSESITQTSLELLLDGCPRLRTLVVAGLDSLNPLFVNELANRYCTDQFWFEPPLP